MIPTTGKLLLALAAVPAVARGQDSVRLRFAPPNGFELHRVFERRQRVDMQLDSLGARVLEVVQLGGIAQVAMQTGTEATAVHLTFDSLRIRRRETGRSWSELEVPGADTTWIQVGADERLQMGLRGGELQPGGGGLLIQSFAGFSGVVLPEHWIRAGMQWQTELLASPSDPLIPGTMDDVALRTKVRFVVDSIVVRSRDTLAYISASGTAVRVRRTQDNGVVLAYSGSLTGNLVWSTGWMAFVSGLSHLNVRVDVRRSGSPDPVGHMIIETTLQQAVVP